MGSSCLGDSLSISLFFLLLSLFEVQSCTPSLPLLPLAALCLPSVIPRAGDTLKTLVPSNSNRPQQPENLRVKSRVVVVGCGRVFQKGKLRRKRSMTACSLSCCFKMKRTGLMMMVVI